MTRLSCLIIALLMVTIIGLGTTDSTKAQPKAALKFEIYKDAQSEFRWRLKAGNNQIIATSGQGYKDKSDCQKGIEIIQAGAAKASVSEE